MWISANQLRQLFFNFLLHVLYVEHCVLLVGLFGCQKSEGRVIRFQLQY